MYKSSTRVISIRQQLEVFDSLRAMAEYRGITMTEMVSKMLGFAMSAKQESCPHQGETGRICRQCGLHLIVPEVSVDNL